MAKPSSSNLHIFMFPWFAMGHVTPFLHFSNILAQKGYKITFLLPKKAQQQLQHFNLYPDLITFHTLTVPPVAGLPEGAETASNVPIHLTHFLSIALDRTRDQVEAFIGDQNPNLVIYDFAHWLPDITKPLGIKTICYTVVCAASIAIALVPACDTHDGKKAISEKELSVPPPGYPSSTVVFREHEMHAMMFLSLPFGEGITFYERITTAMKKCDALSIRTCKELEGQMCEYIGSQYNKPVFLTGPVLPEQPKLALEERWAHWLARFASGSVVFCAFGSQFVLEKDQFQEIILGIELSGFPFLVALKPPVGASTIEEALPEGFEERVKGRGIVFGGWVQQLMILGHPSIGCFVNHCGFGSMWESLMSDCQIVLVPHLGDQILNTRLMVEELKVAVEVRREENGWFSKECLSKAIASVMDKDSEVGHTLKNNHAKWKGTLGNTKFLSGYIDNFVQDMEKLVSRNIE